jgi:hypothetical protein
MLKTTKKKRDKKEEATNDFKSEQIVLTKEQAQEVRPAVSRSSFFKSHSAKPT